MDQVVIGVLVGFLYIFMNTVFANLCLKWLKPQYFRAINSLAIGIITAYLFLVLLPESLQFTDFHAIHTINDLVPIIILLMFSAQVYLHRVISQQVHADIKDRVLHLITNTFYHFVLGMLFLRFSGYWTYGTFLFFAPIFLYGIFTHLTRFDSDLTVHSKRNSIIIKELKLFSNMAVILGVVTASLINLTVVQVSYLLGIVAGTFFFNIFMEHTRNIKTYSNRWMLLGQIILLIIYLLLRI